MGKDWSFSLAYLSEDGKEGPSQGLWANCRVNGSSCVRKERNGLKEFSHQLHELHYAEEVQPCSLKIALT